MKDTKVLEPVKLYSSNQTDPKGLDQFRKMQQFIDASIQNAIALEGPEKISTLVTTLLSLRDFLTNDIIENSFKLNLLKNIQNLENMKEEEEKTVAENVSDTPPPVIKKKERGPEQK